MRRSFRSLVTLVAAAGLVYLPAAGCGGSGSTNGGDDAAGDGTGGSDGTASDTGGGDDGSMAMAEGATDAPRESAIDGIAPDADASFSADASDATVDALVDSQVSDAITDADSSTAPVCTEAPTGASGSATWAHGYGDAGIIDFVHVAVDTRGNVFALGQFQGTINFAGTGDGGTGSLTSAGQKDVFLAKFDANGVHQWSARFGNASTQYAGGLTTDAAGNVYIVGSFYSGIDFTGGGDAGSYSHAYSETTGFVAKFDPGGQYVWSREIGNGSGYEFLYSVADDGLGNIVVGGGLQGSVSFTGTDGGASVVTGAGANDMLVFKLTEGGDFVWARHFGDSGDQNCEALGTDRAGNVYLTGLAGGTISLGSAGTLTAGSGAYGAALIKLGPDGSPQWGQLLTGGADLTGEHVMAVTPAGSAYVAFSSHGAVTLVGADAGVAAVPNAGGTDLVVARFDAAGNYLWARGYGDGSDQWAGGIAVDDDGSAFVTGSFQGSVAITGSDGGPAGWTSQAAWDALVIDLDAAGDFRWGRAFQGPNNQMGTGIAMSGCSPVVGGMYSGNVPFASASDGGSIVLSASTAPSAQDAYLATLMP